MPGPAARGAYKLLRDKRGGALLAFFNKSFVQTFSKVWPPAGPPEAAITSLLNQQKFCSNFFEGAVCRWPPTSIQWGRHPAGPPEAALWEMPYFSIFRINRL